MKITSHEIYLEQSIYENINSVVNQSHQSFRFKEQSVMFDFNPVTYGIFMQVEEAVSRETFAALSANTDPNAQRNQLVKIKTPEAVRHLVGMLTAYDWHFVEQAKELRGYAVAQLVEETKHPDAKIRLRALELLGKVTEVALFTERVEVKKTEMSDAELEAKIKEKLNKMAQIIDVTDVTEVLDIKEKTTEQLNPLSNAFDES
jgi:hypothetical protein